MIWRTFHPDPLKATSLHANYKLFNDGHIVATVFRCPDLKDQSRPWRAKYGRIVFYHASPEKAMEVINRMVEEAGR